ncbi:MAG: NAD(P)H-dependent oxidoreductase [Actinomycetia bacterium]|nr:NAD(P)H-dependent oxidoreductase [Actinomycetes bacterium]
MKAHIVLAHPERHSFNGLLADTSKSRLDSAGWEVTFSDLYGMGFDPREASEHYTERSDEARFHAQTEQRFSADNDATPADVQAEIDKVLACDLLVVHFPLWWFGMPAIMKGWLDRVFVYGKMYRSAMRYDAGICAGKKMIACVTTGASANSCSFNGREADTRLLVWPLVFPFRYVGFDVLEPEVLHGIGGVAFTEGHDDGTSALDRFAQHWSEQIANVSARPVLPYNRDDEFDENLRLRQDAPAHSPFISHASNIPWPPATGEGDPT